MLSPGVTARILLRTQRSYIPVAETAGNAPCVRASTRAGKPMVGGALRLEQQPVPRLDVRRDVGQNRSTHRVAHHVDRRRHARCSTAPPPSTPGPAARPPAAVTRRRPRAGPTSAAEWCNPAQSSATWGYRLRAQPHQPFIGHCPTLTWPDRSSLPFDQESTEEWATGIKLVWPAWKAAPTAPTAPSEPDCRGQAGSERTAIDQG